MIDKPELRQDVVSGDWVLVAPGRRRRPQEFVSGNHAPQTPKSQCPFEDPQKADNGEPLLWYSRTTGGRGPVGRDWVLQVVENKYPAVARHTGSCPVPLPRGLYQEMEGIGFHEIVIPRSHTKFLADMTADEAELIVRAYQERIVHYSKEACLAYALVFHNHGDMAGASVWHPHSQIIALPIIPPDVRRSLDGARRFWQGSRQCVHCNIIKWEKSEKERLVYSNSEFIVIAPFASHVNFEVRIFPIKHSSRFEEITRESRLLFADALTTVLRRLKKVLKNPAYNFFIHTAPIERGEFDYYHWHLEILPKTSHLAGVELGTGVEVITMPPEEAAKFLANA